MKKKPNPCINHRTAYPNKDVAEIKGMQKHGIKFRKCKRCGWVIKKPKGPSGLVLEIKKEAKGKNDWKRMRIK